MSQPPYFVGLDVGGSTMKAGAVDDAGQCLSSVSVPTEAERGQELGLRRMCDIIRQAAAQAGLPMERVADVGVATPGTMDIPAGVMLDPFNLKPWQNVPVRAYLQQELGLPVAFQNDANAAAQGEFWLGAGRGARSMVLFTLGTGIGGGIVLGDLVVEGEHSHGAELGHMKIEMTNPRRCGCGGRGCLEAYASATAVTLRALDALAGYSGGSALRGLVEQRGADALTCRDVFTAAEQGDALAERLVEETAYYLAVGATNAMNVIDPDVVVFGGGMIAAGEGFLERIRWHVRRLAFPVPAARTQVRYAHLGADAGFIGAAACARLLRKRLQAGSG